MGKTLLSLDFPRWPASGYAPVITMMATTSSHDHCRHQFEANARKFGDTPNFLRAGARRGSVRMDKTTARSR
jgi:hypothetical protein